MHATLKCPGRIKNRYAPCRGVSRDDLPLGCDSKSNDMLMLPGSQTVPGTVRLLFNPLMRKPADLLGRRIKNIDAFTFELKGPRISQARTIAHLYEFNCSSLPRLHFLGSNTLRKLRWNVPPREHFTWMIEGFLIFYATFTVYESKTQYNNSE